MTGYCKGTAAGKLLEFDVTNVCTIERARQLVLENLHQEKTIFKEPILFLIQGGKQ